MPRGDPARTREKLLAAGQRVAQRQAFAALRVDDVVREAGVAKGTFFLHFADRAAFLVALHAHFHEAVSAAVDEATAARAPGLARLLAGSLRYLEVCRRDHPVKALLLGARSEPAIQSAVTRQNERFARVAERDFTAARWPDAKSAARLWIGMVAEAAIAEAESDRALPGVRRALARFLSN